MLRLSNLCQSLQPHGSYSTFEVHEHDELKASNILSQSEQAICNCLSYLQAITMETHTCVQSTTCGQPKIRIV